jgi:type IV secretory pathway VirB2 component (pilin)
MFYKIFFIITLFLIINNQAYAYCTGTIMPCGSRPSVDEDDRTFCTRDTVNGFGCRYPSNPYNCEDRSSISEGGGPHDCAYFDWDEAGCNARIDYNCIWVADATGVGNAGSTADDNALVVTMCNALGIVTGSGGKAFAAFAIISVGIGFFTGKVSWGLMIGVAAGIAAMFGAPTIVAAISGEDTIDCS